MSALHGVPGAIRTRGLSLRWRTLYPAELRRHICIYVCTQIEHFNYSKPSAFVKVEKAFFVHFTINFDLLSLDFRQITVDKRVFWCYNQAIKIE